MKNNLNLLEQKGAVQILFILILLAGIIAGVYLVQQTQIFGPRAASVPITGYSLQLLPTQNVIMQVSTATTGYAVYALLKDSNGKVVTDQKDFNYRWEVVGKDGVISVTPFAACTNGIQSPCPNDHATIKGLKLGTARLTVVVGKASEKKIVAKGLFTVRVAKIISPSQPITSCKVGLNSFSVEQSCTGGYRFMNYSCYDGVSGRSGGDTSCKSSGVWNQYAQGLCKGHSSCSSPKPTSVPKK